METGWYDTTWYGRSAFFVAIVCFLFHIFGFYTVSWTVYSFRNLPPNDILLTRYIGLWEKCIASYFRTDCQRGPYESWLEATQAFETLGFIAGLAALVLIVLYIFVPSTAGKKIVFILAMIACFAAAACIILGIIIYGAKMDNLSWSFALCTIAGIVFGVAGVLLLLDFCKR